MKKKKNNNKKNQKIVNWKKYVKFSMYTYFSGELLIFILSILGLWPVDGGVSFLRIGVYSMAYYFMLKGGKKSRIFILVMFGIVLVSMCSFLVMMKFNFFAFGIIIVILFYIMSIYFLIIPEPIKEHFSN